MQPANPLTNSTYYTVSPYVVADGVTNYGSGFVYNAATNVTTEAAGTTLVPSIRPRVGERWRVQSRA